MVSEYTYCEILGKGNWISRKTVEDMNNKGEILKNLVNPPLKDNVAVPDAGFTVVRFVADNVGYWLFHCHMNWHNHLGEIFFVNNLAVFLIFWYYSIQVLCNIFVLFSGMGLVIKVGNVEKTIQPPPKGFPKCGNFVGCDVE